MKEIKFLHNNSSKWQTFESEVNSKRNQNTDKHAESFVEILDDLSYAKTYYPKSKTFIYLNQLSARIQQKIYKNNKESWRGIKDFWIKELPEIFSKVQKELLIALLIFIFGISIGFISSNNDDTFVRLVLGDGYVNMTERFIDKGEPMAVYKSSKQMDMFLGITLNNIKVSFAAFIYGLFFAVGSAYILFVNGIMLGAFHAFFYQKGLFWETFLTIWIHGSFELSAIVIAGAAGIILGKSIMFRGTYSLKDSFIRSGRFGIKMISGLIPIFIIAGFLESFVTRYHEMHLTIKLFIILSSLTFVAWFFVINPLKIKNRHKRWNKTHL